MVQPVVCLEEGIDLHEVVQSDVVCQVHAGDVGREGQAAQVVGRQEAGENPTDFYGSVACATKERVGEVTWNKG